MQNKNCRDVTVLEMRPVGQMKSGAESAGAFYELRLEDPGWSGWKPGQFVMLRPPSWGLELTWGRPFSICMSGQGWFSVFFQVLGRGTAKLATLEAGDVVTVWGPLGNGFAMEPDTPTLCLAGGVGIAPFMGYTRAHPSPERVEVLFAHRVEQGCYPLGNLAEGARLSCVREAAPEDLPAVIAAVEAKVEEYRAGLILCCGPSPFMRTVQRKALELGARAQLSLENRMACGVGACLGCVCGDGKGNNVQTCTRGPVFWATDVEL